MGPVTHKWRVWVTIVQVMRFDVVRGRTRTRRDTHLPSFLFGALFFIVLNRHLLRLTGASFRWPFSCSRVHMKLFFPPVDEFIRKMWKIWAKLHTMKWPKRSSEPIEKCFFKRRRSFDREAGFPASSGWTFSDRRKKASDWTGTVIQPFKAGFSFSASSR